MADSQAYWRRLSENNNYFLKKTLVMKVLFRLIGVLLRIVKVILIACLMPAMFFMMVFTILFFIPILMFIDFFKYILTGKGDVLGNFLIGEGRYEWFDFEQFIFGWLVWLSDMYNKYILKRFE